MLWSSISNSSDGHWKVSSISWHHKTVGIVTQLAPGQLRQRLAGKQRNIDRREFDANSDLGTALGQGSWNQEFIISKPAVGSLHDVLRRAQFGFGIGIDAGIAARQIPDTGALEFSSHPSVLHSSHEHLRALVRKLIIQFP